MSGFDVTFRSQQMLAPIQMEAAQRRNAGIARIGDAAAQVAEMRMRKTESDARLAGFEQSRQLDAYKLQQMMQLDQAGMSRYQVEQARLVTESAQLGVDEQREKARIMKEGEPFESETRKNKLTSIRQDLMGKTPADRLQSGYVPDPDAPNGWRKAKDAKELEQARADSAKFEREQHPSSMTGDRMRDQLSRELQRINAVIGSKSFIELSDSEQAAYRAEAARIFRALQGYDYGSGRPGVAGPGTPPPGTVEQIGAPGMSGTISRTTPLPPGAAEPQMPPPPQMGALNAEPISRASPNPFAAEETPHGQLAASAWESPVWSDNPSWQSFGQDEPTKRAMSQAIGVYASQLAEHRNISHEMAARYVFAAADKHPELMGVLLTAADYDPMDIRVVLQRRFPALKDADRMDRVLESIDRDTARMIGGGKPVAVPDNERVDQVNRAMEWLRENGGAMASAAPRAIRTAVAWIKASEEARLRRKGLDELDAETRRIGEEMKKVQGGGR